jgi:hypothetical protein
VVSWNDQKPVFPEPINLKGQGKRISDIVNRARSSSTWAEAMAAPEGSA